MPKLGDERPLNGADLERIAESLEYFAKRYRSLAQQVLARGENTRLAVKMWDSLDLGMKKVQKAVNAAQMAYDEQFAAWGFSEKIQSARENDEFNTNPPEVRDKKAEANAEAIVAENSDSPSLSDSRQLDPKGMASSKGKSKKRR